MNTKFSKLIVVAVILGTIYGFYAFDLGQYLRLEYLQTQKEHFQEYYLKHPGLTLGAYFGIYILTTTLSLPGATILTLAGGALFGFSTGLLIVSFASSIGATFAFLAARFVLRESVQKRFSEKLRSVNEGFEKDGGFYLLTLRIMPIFPFFVVNLLMGLTPIRTPTFFLVSQLGMLPGTAVYVNAGTQLGQLKSIQGILSPTLLFSFMLLGLIPLCTKLLLNYMRSRKYLSRYSKPKQFDYNVVVIGAGSGGLVAAYIAAITRARVALIEREKMGGDCLNTGCVPSKALIRSAKVASLIKRGKEFGFKNVSAELDFAQVMERVQQVIRKVAPHDSVARYTQLGVECHLGEGKILSPYEVQIGENKKITTRSIIIATGGRPVPPPVRGAELIDVLNSDNVWKIRSQPKRFLVLGAGPIGCELAQCFQRLGSKVTLVQKGPRILPREDWEASDRVLESFRKDGIRVLTDHTATEFRVDDGVKKLLCDHDGQPVSIEFDEVLCALGRKANVSHFGLEDLEIELRENRTIQVDSLLRTNYPNIYAVGDVTGPYQFTHFASHQAWYAAVNALFSPFKTFRANYRVIPWCTFTDPEVARVGLSEEEAKAQGIPHEVTTYELDDLDRAIADGEDHGIVKVLTVPGKDKILGAMITGDHAGDYIVEFVSAMQHGFGLNKILGTIHIYPTLGEANKYVAGNWKKARAPLGLLEWVARFHKWRRGGTDGPNDPGASAQDPLLAQPIAPVLED